MYTRSVW